MATTLQVRPRDGVYVVVDAAGEVVGRAASQASALSTAISMLHEGEGGRVQVLRRTGEVSSDIPVAGRRSPSATAANSAVADSPASRDETEDESEDPVGDALEKAAEAVDEALGLPNAPDVLPEGLGDIKINEIVNDTPTTRVIHQHVNAGALWLAIVALVTGAGGISAVVQAARRAAAAEATLSAYADVVTAIVASFALCCATAALAWGLLSGRIKSFGALAGWVLGAVVFSFVLTSQNVPGPTGESMLQSLSRSPHNPPGWVIGVMRAYASYYGPVTFLSGLGVGVIIGRLIWKLEQASKEPHVA